MTLQTTAIVRFDPDATPGTPAGPVERLTIVMTTVVRGLVRTVMTTGGGLSASLTLHFAAALLRICERVHLTGISPAGHAPFALGQAGYFGSSFGYADPQTDVFYVFTGDDDDDGDTLAIGTPCANVYPFFRWPAPQYRFDPPLDDGELAPEITLALDRFEGLDGETETGVRLPMRLVLKNGAQEFALKTLIYEDAPHFTGSGTAIRCKLPDSIDPQPPSDALFAVTGKDVRDALGPEKGDFELYWRTYHGSGDMYYKAVCAERQLLETHQDRRNAGIGGGGGDVLTSDLLAAKIRVEESPWPFGMESETGPLYLSADGETRTEPAHLFGERLFLGKDLKGRDVALSWNDGQSGVHCQGRVLLAAPFDVYAVGLRTVEVTRADDTKVNVLELLTLSRDVSQWRVHGKRLHIGAAPEPVLLATLAKPEDLPDSATIEGGCGPAENSIQFSQDGTQILAYRSGFQDGDRGKIWQIAWSTETEWSEPFLSGLSERPSWEVDNGTITGISCGRATTTDRTFERHWLLAAFWRDNEIIVRMLHVVGAAGGSGQTVHNSPSSATFDSYRQGSWDLFQHFEEYFCHANPADEEDVWFCIGSDKDGRVAAYATSEEINAVSYDTDFEIVTTSTGAWIRVSVEVTENGAAIDSFVAVDFTSDSEYIERYYGCGPAFWSDNNFWNTYCNDVTGVCTTYINAYNRFVNNDDHSTYTLTGSGHAESYEFLTHSPRPEIYTKCKIQGSTFDTKDGTLVLYADNVEIATVTGIPEYWMLSSYDPAVISNNGDRYGGEHQPGGALYEGLGELNYRLSAIAGHTLAYVRTIDKDANEHNVLAIDGNELSGDDIYQRIGVMLPGTAWIAPPIDPSARPGNCGMPSPPTGDALIAAINAVRTAAGLTALTKNPLLAEAIAIHLAWLKTQGLTVSHDGPDGSTPESRASDAGYRDAVGELLVTAVETIALALDTWELDAADHATLHDPAWHDIGVAILAYSDSRYWIGVMVGATEST